MASSTLRYNSCSTYQSTAFSEAVTRYIESIPPEKRKKDAIVICYEQDSVCTAETINNMLAQRCDEHVHHTSKAWKFFRRVVAATKDYEGIINNFASANPMPVAIIWGALGIVINTAERYFACLDVVESQLGQVADTLEKITRYDWLFGEHDAMQKLILKSYTSLLHFWSRVHRGIQRSKPSAIAHAAFSSNIRKLNILVDEMTCNAKEIRREATLLSQGVKQLQDKQAVVKAWLERMRCVQSAGAVAKYERLRDKRAKGSCEWLFTQTNYSMWSEAAPDVRLLWLSAPPGSGKSTICSRAIQHMLESDTPPPTAYYFYRFDETSRALDVLAHLADQLLACFTRQFPSDDHLHKNLEAFCALEKVIIDFGSSSHLLCAKELIKLILRQLPPTFIFIDGVDEETRPEMRRDSGAKTLEEAKDERWNAAKEVMTFFTEIIQDGTNEARVWVSSQNIPCIAMLFDNPRLRHLIRDLDVTDKMKGDMINYLSSQLADKVSEYQRAIVVDKRLKEPAGSWLWAELTISGLSKLKSKADRTRFIAQDLTLNDYYSTFFKNMEQHDRTLTCYAFGLVAFARRPLRMGEVREAIGILKSRDMNRVTESVQLDHDEMPDTRDLPHLFAPLIEVDPEEHPGEAEDLRTCRLCHPTVLDFLLNRPDILCQSGDTTPPIRARIMADACLLYLSQPHFTNLLRREGADSDWLDSTGTSVASLRFLTYSAKYWNKHLDFSRIQPDQATIEYFIKRVSKFLKSTNFQTCLQVQSLFLEAQFEVFSGSSRLPLVFLRRIFPDWFNGGDLNNDFRQDYNSFWREWHHLLSCGGSDLCDRVVRPCHGQLDRCWWGALGPENFLSQMTSRYLTYPYWSKPSPTIGAGIDFQAVGVCRAGIRILRLRSLRQGRIVFTVAAWGHKEGARPTLLRPEVKLTVDDANDDIMQYIRRVTVEAVASEESDGSDGRRDSEHEEDEEEGQDRMAEDDDREGRDEAEQFELRKDRGSLATFSADCRYLRIGPQILEETESGVYKAIGTQEYCAGGHYPKYVEDFAHRGDLLVLASRRAPYTSSDLKKETCGEFREQPRGSDSDDSDGFDDFDETSSGSSDYSGDDEAYETWSECSSAGGRHMDSNNPTYVNNCAAESETGSDSCSSDGDIEEEGEEEGHVSSESESDDAASVSDSTSADEDIDPEELAYGQLLGHVGEGYMSDEDGNRIYCPPRKKTSRDGAPPSNPKACISVFARHEGRVFHFSRSLPVMLFDSPPVIHPTLPLVVWPLGAGDVLFADVEVGTYFIRKIYSSAEQSRLIFMQMQFSPCGCYLHVASLEGRRASEVDNSLSLALVVRTYRLCRNQPTRTPPSLLHSDSGVRVQLDTVPELPVPRLPFKLWWTPQYLFVTWSHLALRVFRVRLFPRRGEGISFREVLRPTETILLPASAQRREVHFVPPEDGQNARVVIGSVIKKDADYILLGMSPSPVGCSLYEGVHLRGWTDSEYPVDTPRRRGGGKLQEPLEKFDPEEDCDLEPFFFFS